MRNIVQGGEAMIMGPASFTDAGNLMDSVAAARAGATSRIIFRPI